MARRPLLLLLLTLPFVLAAPAAGDDYSHKQAVDAELAQLQARMAQSSAREDSLSSSISSATGDIRALEQRVGDVTSRLEALQQDLDLHRTRLAHLNELLQLQTKRLEFLRGQYVTAMQRLDRRIVQLYKQEQPSTLDVVVSSASISDALDQLDYMRHLGDQDLNASAQVTVARDAMRILRAQTRDTQRGVAAATRIIAIRTAQQLELQNELLARRSGLLAARRSQQQALASVRSNYRDDASEAAALEKVSSQLAAQIQAAQAAAQQTYSPTASVTQSSPSSSSGFIWPVSGPVVSGFGWRWGRMHEGIDVGVGYGTPIRAVASGTIITAGWEGGYGNLIVIDHGGGLATAYAHQSSFAVGYGQHVEQGQVIGYVGCTGHCFGPHVHFEVRINGAPVDPLGYL